MKLRFSIRDLLWLALVVALAVGWWIDRRAADFRKMQMESQIKNLHDALSEERTMESRLDTMLRLYQSGFIVQKPFLP
jgi:hypothetical protein